MQVTHFVTGHHDVTPEQFATHYEPQLRQAAKEKDAEFVMLAAQQDPARSWLIANGVEPRRITNYALKANQEAIDILDGSNTIVGFRTLDACNRSMAAVSHYALTWRPCAYYPGLVPYRYWRAAQSNTSSCEMMSHEPRECVTVYHRHGPGNVTKMEVCLGCLANNFTSSEDAKKNK